MQEGKQPLWAGVQLFARLTLNAGADAANQTARLSHLDDGNDRAILVQGNEGPAQIVRLGHRGTPSIDVKRRNCHLLAARPIASLSAGGRWIRTSCTRARSIWLSALLGGFVLGDRVRVRARRFWDSAVLATGLGDL